jgi:hypothetical protein
MWEGALLKLAGWQHLSRLTLSQLRYGNDWRLLRTLPVQRDAPSIALHANWLWCLHGVQLEAMLLSALNRSHVHASVKEQPPIGLVRSPALTARLGYRLPWNA